MILSTQSSLPLGASLNLGMHRGARGESPRIPLFVLISSQSLVRGIVPGKGKIWDAPLAVSCFDKRI